MIYFKIIRIYFSCTEIKNEHTQTSLYVLVPYINLSLTCHSSITDAVMRLFSICSLITFDLILYVNSAIWGEQQEKRKPTNSLSSWVYRKVIILVWIRKCHLGRWLTCSPLLASVLRSQTPGWRMPALTVVHNLIKLIRPIAVVWLSAFIFGFHAHLNMKLCTSCIFVVLTWFIILLAFSVFVNQWISWLITIMT